MSLSLFLLKLGNLLLVLLLDIVLFECNCSLETKVVRKEESYDSNIEVTYFVLYYRIVDVVREAEDKVAHNQNQV